MNTLKILNPYGRALIDAAFLASEDAVVTPTDSQVSMPDRVIDLSDLSSVVRECVETFGEFDTAMDGYAAPKIHKALRLTRREAAEVGVWHYLAGVAYPEFVRHRWRPESGSRTEDRFLGNHVRNAFARLWWGAELTVRPHDDYDATKFVFSKSQDLYESIFGRDFSRYPQAVHAFLKVVGSEPQDVFRKTAKDFNHVLTTVLLESADQPTLEQLLAQLVARNRRVGSAA